MCGFPMIFHGKLDKLRHLFCCFPILSDSVRRVRMFQFRQAMQVKLNKMRVEQLELQAANKELTEKFDQVKIEAEKAEKQLTNQLSISTWVPLMGQSL